MKPLNTEERKKAFSKFLIFFIATTLLVVLAVFFGQLVPGMQNEDLSKQIAASNKEKDFVNSFSAKMDETKHLLDSVNRPEVQSELVDGKIDENLKRMNAMIDNDSITEKKFYHDVVASFADLKFAKKQLRDASGKDANLSNSQKEIETLKSDLAQARAEANTLRLQIMSSQQSR